MNQDSIAVHDYDNEYINGISVDSLKNRNAGRVDALIKYPYNEYLIKYRSPIQEILKASLKTNTSNLFINVSNDVICINYTLVNLDISSIAFIISETMKFIDTIELSSLNPGEA